MFTGRSRASSRRPQPAARRPPTGSWRWTQAEYNIEKTTQSGRTAHREADVLVVCNWFETGYRGLAHVAEVFVGFRVEGVRLRV